MIELRNVSFGYQPGVPVLSGVDVALPAGLTLLLGPNGSGKSTLLRIAAGVECPETGTVHIEGHDAWRDEVAARRDLAYVPEQPDLSPYASVSEVLELVCRLRNQPKSAVGAALDLVGLTGHGARSVRELSMGQRRRAVLAAAFIGRPRVALLDEPLEAMDRGARATIVEWIAGLVRDEATVVVATHDLEPLAPLASRAVAVLAGEVNVVESLPSDPAERLQLLDSLARGTARPRQVW